MSNTQPNFSDELSLIPVPEVHPSMTAIRHDRTLKNNNNTFVPVVALLRKFFPFVEQALAAHEERIAHLESAVNKAAEAKPAAKKETAKA